LEGKYLWQVLILLVAYVKGRVAEMYLALLGKNGNVLNIEMFVIGVFLEAYYPIKNVRSVVLWLWLTNLARVIINGSK